MGAAAVAHDSTVSALTEREQRVQATFTVARASIRAAQATQTALACADVSTALDRLHERSGGVVGSVYGAAQAEVSRMQDAADGATRKVSASGAALRAEIAARPIGDLHAEVPDITSNEVQAVESVIGEAKASAMGAVLDAEREADVKLHTGARENGAAFTSSAATVVEQVSARLPET